VEGYLVGDSRLVLSQLNRDSVDLVVTDPPYGIGYRRTGQAKQRADIMGDNPHDAPLILREVMREVARVLKPGGTVYVFCPGGKAAFRQGAALVRELEASFDIRQTLIWDKKSIGPGWYWRNQYETVVMASKGRVATWEGGKSRANIVRFGRTRTIGHPSPKPLPLIEELIRCSSRPGDLVLDPFAGTGVVGAAAGELGRRWLCIDCDPKWAEEANQRYGLDSSYFDGK
jgi:DNA modification methylase